MPDRFLLPDTLRDFEGPVVSLRTSLLDEIEELASTLEVGVRKVCGPPFPTC